MKVPLRSLRSLPPGGLVSRSGRPFATDMCEVCAIFGVGEHWAESAPRAAANFPAAEIQNHRGERRRRIDLLNAWLEGERVTVHDWDGEAFCVEDGSGRRRIAADLSALWPAIEALAGHPFDPLADELAYGPR